MSRRVRVKGELEVAIEHAPRANEKVFNISLSSLVKSSFKREQSNKWRCKNVVKTNRTTSFSYVGVR